MDESKKYKQTLADGTEVEVEDVPINRALIEAGAVLPDSERRGSTPEELHEDGNRANALFVELSEPPHPNEILGIIQGVLEANSSSCLDNDQERDTLALHLEVALRPITRAKFDG